VLEGARGPFTVVALHLSFVPGWNVGQLVAVRRWIADLPTPHLLLGDFNLVGRLPQLVLSGASLAHGMAWRGWRDLARTPTYPSHRPVVQFDHVLAAGIPPGAVGAVSTPQTPISDHRPLVVELAW
jgi:endonuclease/exonuclease/phosphatase family metal-dependent hydrolase